MCHMYMSGTSSISCLTAQPQAIVTLEPSMQIFSPQACTVSHFAFGYEQQPDPSQHLVTNHFEELASALFH